MIKSKRSLNSDLDNITPILLGIWRRMHKLSGPADKLQTREFRSVIVAVKALQEKSLQGESFIGKDYFKDINLLGAHLLYEWVIHYQQGLSIFGELPNPCKRVLDVCSGASPFGFAALRHGAEEVIAIDQNNLALQAAGEICGRYGHSLTVRPWHYTSNCLEKFPEGKFDLIILGHCLEELFPPAKKGWVEAQNSFIKALLSRLTEEGYLAIIDNSFLEMNRRILQLRDQLVSEGVSVQAPCVWKGECPALKTADSPCYAQREFEKTYLIKEIQRASSINLSSLKMTYLIFRNKEAGWPVLNTPFYRVISPPVETYSGKRFYLCGTEGKKQLSSHLKTHPKESRAFEYLRRGELISISEGLEKQGAIDIVEGTKVNVVAAGKPLPDLP